MQGGAIVCQEKLLEVKRCCCRSGDSSKDKEVMLPFIRRSLFWPGYTVGSLNLLHIDEHHKNLTFCIFSSNHQIMNFLFLSSIVHKFSFTYFVILCRIYDNEKHRIYLYKYDCKWLPRLWLGIWFPPVTITVPFSKTTRKACNWDWGGVMYEYKKIFKQRYYHCSVLSLSVVSTHSWTHGLHYPT